MAGFFYLLTGLILLFSALGLYFFTNTAGFRFLSIGLFLFFLYSVGKGLVMVYIAHKRQKYYAVKKDLTHREIQEELRYTQYRIDKKYVNRRRYVWMAVIFSFFAFIGIFSSQKAIIMGTSIPVALISGIELGVGLLTEFRLREYHRILSKALV